MITANFDPFPVLETERLVLRQVLKSDVDEVFFLRSDEGVMKYIDRPRAQNTGDALEYIQKLDDWLAAQEGINWCITQKGDDRLLGMVGFWHFRQEDLRAELGYVLHPDFQGKGIMAEAIGRVLDYGFASMDLHAIEAYINPKHSASIKAVERHGFQKEAQFRDYFQFEGQFTDISVYVILEGDRK